MKKVLLILMLVMGLFCISTSANALVLDAVDSGWYDDSGDHNNTNDNYISGAYSGAVYQNWFVFDLAPVTDTVSAATLRLDLVSVTATATYTLWDVTTDISALRAGGTGLTSIYADLGTGTKYGQSIILSSDSRNQQGFVLNADAINAINASSGLFAISGSYASKTDYAFGNSGNKNNIKQLVLDTEGGSENPVVPEPATIALFSTGLLGAFFRKRA